MFLAVVMLILFGPLAWFIAQDQMKWQKGVRHANDPATNPTRALPQDGVAIMGAAQPNERFLNEVRQHSCYPVLRGAHAVITIFAVVATVFLWGVLLDMAADAATRVYVSFVCGVVIVALLIEYGLFRLIVDAVDVLIDTGRRQAANESGK